jgi:hypothetical protein
VLAGKTASVLGKAARDIMHTTQKKSRRIRWN